MGAALKIGGAKGGESKPRQPYKAPDSALSIATAKMLYIISEGEIAGPVNDAHSFKLDGTPLITPDGSEAFPGTTWEFRSGSVDQEHIAGFPAAEYEQSAGLPVELRSDVAWTRAVTNRDLSAVRVRLSWPQIWQVKTNGDQVGYRIDYVIELSIDGGAFNNVLSATLDDKGTTEYERSHRIDLPQGFSSAVLRVRRLTANRNDSNFADVMRVKALTEVIDAKLRYPNLALAAMQYDASQFSNIPKFSLLCRGRIIKVPSNYDPVTRTYIANWDGTFKLAYSNNPAWVWYDLLLHRRYGLGRRITADMVDRWSLYEIGRYCDVMVPDGKGGMQPRMTTNVYIQDQVEGYALLSDLASVFRGSSCWNGSKVTVIADIPGNDDGYVFTRSNIVGEFEYGAIALPDRHTRAKISWDNPDNEFKTEPTAVTNEDMIGILGHRMLDAARFACTVEGEAIRHGVWALKSEQYETWTVRFTTGMEGRNIEPGQIIGVADELLSGRANGGRISAATARVITLDFDAQVQPEDRLILNLPNGKAEGRIVKSVSGRQVTVMADYSELPEPESAWSVESADLGVMRFRVNTIEPKGMHQWEITGVQHEPDKFDAIDHGARVDPQPITVLPPGVIDPPESVAITSRSVVSQGIAVTTMRISWPAVKGAVAYDVEWRKDNGSWMRLPRTGTLGAEVEGIYSGGYQARVSAVSVMDVSSVFAMSALVDLKGKEGLPPGVTHLTASSELFAIRLKWGFPAGAEDTQRTEIWYGSTNDLEAATKLADLAYPQADYVMQGLKAGVSLFFWARLVDRTGNIGPWSPTGNGVLGQSGADASPVLELISGQITESELGQDLLSEIEKISGEGPESVNGRIEAAKQELEDLITDLTDPLEYVATNTYAKDDAVRSGQRLYMAIAPVPAAANGSNAPPNPTYWVDIGSIASTANGLAQAVAKNTTDIATVDGKVTVNAAMLQAVQSAHRDENPEGALTDALRGWDTLAKVSEESRTRATQSEAMASRVTGVEARVDRNTGSIRSLEQTVVTNEQATASRFSEVTTKVGSNSASISALEKTVTDNESSTASRLQSVNARVDAANQALDQEKLDRDSAVTGERQAREAAVENEATARADGDDALGLLVDTVSAQVDENTSKIQTVEQAQADTDQAVASMRTTIEAVYTTGRDDNAEGELAGALKAWESTAKIAEEAKTRATEIDAQAKKTETLEVSFNSALDKTNGEVQKNSAAVQTTSQALAAVDGTVRTMWSVKMEVHSSGKYVLAGLGLAIENGKSQMVVLADQFAVTSSLNGEIRTFFAVQNGQAFMDSAFIMDGTITNAKIGSYISSTNYVAGQQGWILNKSGTFEINGTVAGQGRLLINNQRLRIYHANGNLAIDLGVNV
ncbi:hypothetical protein PshuTeo2_05520 [Pseudomonas hunanensis]|uniref:phage tail tip fiber protein n=1 Tax=Pseudomonas hunanensis TaxID=1247546 RepID=UPI002AA0C827|nr:DUF1983 domain-containing protein [Pseudomonas hunanensis]MDY7070530.1 hypothetical protein [Pseudomonas hunanensis]